MQHATQPTVDDVVTASEALGILGLKNRSSVSLMVKCGELTPVRRLSVGYLFRRSDVEALRDARAEATAS